MRLECFEVTIVHPDGTPFHEIFDPSSQTHYVVAEPSALYEVKVARHDDRRNNRLYQFNLKVRPPR